MNMHVKDTIKKLLSNVSLAKSVSFPLLIFILGIIIGFFLDGINQVCYSHLEINFIWGWAAPFRFVLLLFFIVYLIFYNPQRLILVGIWVVSVIVGVVSYSHNINLPLDYLLFNITRLSKYLLPIISLYYIIDISNKNNQRFIFKAAEIIILINSIAIIIGFVFNIDLLRTYNGNRFGYSGFINFANDASYFQIVGVCMFHVKYYLEKGSIVGLMLTIVASLLLGTKVIYLFLLLYATFLLVISKNKKYIVFVFILCFSAIFIVLYKNHYFSWMWQLKEDRGWLNMLTSLRFDHAINRIPNVINSWSSINWIFGGGLSQNSMVEMDFIDLFIFSGILGLFLYLLLLFKTFFVTKIRAANLFCIFFIIIFLLIGGVGGHVFATGVSSLLVATLMLRIRNIEYV